MVLIALLMSITIFIFTFWLRLTSATVLECFKYHPNYYLGRSGNLVVVNISSINSCLDHCLKSQLLYQFICRSAMVNKLQRECVLSKWSPNLATFSRYHPKVLYTAFYQNICLSPWDQIRNFTVAPPRTTFSIPISNTRLLASNSINDVIKNYKSLGNVHDISVNTESKKKATFEAVLSAARHVPPPNTISRTSHRITVVTETTTPSSQKTTSYYTDYDEDERDNSKSNRDCNNNNKYDDINDDNSSNNNGNGDARGDDHGDDDDDDDDIYNNAYEDSEANSDLISPNDEQYTSTNKGTVSDRMVPSILTPVRTIKSIVIKPAVNRDVESSGAPTEISPTISFISTALITPFTDPVTITSANDNTAILITTTPVIITSTTTTSSAITTVTTTTVASALQFIPVPIEMLVPEWNTTTKDSELSIQHQNYTLNFTIVEQDPNNRQMIRNGLIKELQCFHYFANNQLTGYQQEIIKRIGLQDCLHNCILRVSFLCMSINYNKQTEECVLNDGNRIINNVQLTPSKTADYYEYVCLSARRHESKPIDDNIGSYNITKLRKCFSICENAVMYTLNGFVVDNIYTPLECLMTCTLSHQVYKTKCYSINWFKNSRTCYLHTIATNINDLKVTTSTDFFLNNCADSISALSASAECETDYCDD